MKMNPISTFPALRFCGVSLTVAAALLSSSPAYALSCDELMNMVDVSVPTNIIVQTIEGSGETFSSAEVRCLQEKGAPAEVVSAAKSMMASAAPEEPEDSPKPAAKSSSKDSFDSDDGVGDQQSRNKLEDKGGDPDEGDATRDPEKLENAIKAYEAKKPLTASLAFFEMLRDNQYPDKEAKIQYYLARSLYDLTMYHSSQYYFTEVIKKGPSTPYFSKALPKLVTIAKFTGDDSDLVRIVAKVSIEEFPASARNQYYYLTGLKLYENDKLTEARKSFGQVSEKSDLYTKSKYFEGVIYYKQEKLRSAVKSFTEVVKSNTDAQTPQEVEDMGRLRDLSLLNIARIYYSIQRFPEANTWYDNVPRDSQYWAEAQFESGWSDFVQSDVNRTLGQMLTVQSPFFDKQEFIPEAKILRALTFFNLCEYKEVGNILESFDADYKPMQEEMKDFVKQYNSEVGKKLADQAYDRYFGSKPAKTLIPKAAFVRILRNQDLAGIVNHLQVMQAEERLIDEQKSQWKDSLGENLHKVMAEDRDRLKRRAGLKLLQEISTMATMIGGLLGQSQIIQFEMTDAIRGDYEYKLTSQDVQDTSKEFEIDFATSANRIYWPFNGEFWQDELGYYWYTEQGSCK